MDAQGSVAELPETPPQGAEQATTAPQRPDADSLNGTGAKLAESDVETQNEAVATGQELTASSPTANPGSDTEPGLSIRFAVPPERRISGRQRVATRIFEVEDLPSRATAKPTKKEAAALRRTEKEAARAAKASQKEAGAHGQGQDEDKETEKEKGATGKSKKSKRARERAEEERLAKKKPRLLAKLRYRNTQPPPRFDKIDIGNGETDLDLFWLRVVLREFLLRFDKLCRLPTRHATTINDPLQPWNDYLYKAAVVALFRLIMNDSVPIFAQTRQFLSNIEHTPADSPALWELLSEFLAQCDPYAAKADAFSGEQYRLELIRRLMVLATGSGTIRVTVQNDHEQLQQLQKESAEQVKKYQTAWTETQAKLEKLKASDEQMYRDKYAAAERAAQDRIYRTEQTIYQQVRKYNLRTAPLGQDNAGNQYWGLQQKSKDMPSWGTWVICDMRRLPGETDGKKIADYIAGMVSYHQRAVKEHAAQVKAQKKAKLEAKIEAKQTTSEPDDQRDGERNGELNGEPKSGPNGDNSERAITEPERTETPETAIPGAKYASDDVKKDTKEAESETAEPVTEQVDGPVKAANVDVKSPEPAAAPAPEEELKPKSEEKPKGEKEVVPTKKLRKPRVPVFEAKPGVFYIEGRDNLLALASWIKGQPGAAPEPLVSEIETLAQYSYD